MDADSKRHDAGRQISKGLLVPAIVLNAALVAAAVYVFGSVDFDSPSLSGPLSRGMPRSDVISLKGAPAMNVQGSHGTLIDKYKTPGGGALYIFYDEDTRVSSFFARRY